MGDFRESPPGGTDGVGTGQAGRGVAGIDVRKGVPSWNTSGRPPAKRYRGQENISGIRNDPPRSSPCPQDRYHGPRGSRGCPRAWAGQQPVRAFGSCKTIHGRRRRYSPCAVEQYAYIAAKYLLPAEEEKARERQLAAQNNDAGQAVRENLPEQAPEGRARDLAAAKVGLSGKTVDAAARAIEDGIPAKTIRRWWRQIQDETNELVNNEQQPENQATTPVQGGDSGDKLTPQEVVREVVKAAKSFIEAELAKYGM